MYTAHIACVSQNNTYLQKKQTVIIRTSDTPDNYWTYRRVANGRHSRSPVPGRRAPGAFVCFVYEASSMTSASMMSVSSWRSGIAFSSSAASDAVSLWV